MNRLTLDGTAVAVSRDQTLRRERGQGNINFPCSADHEQDWQPYPVYPYPCHMCDHTHIPGTYIHYCCRRNDIVVSAGVEVTSETKQKHIYRAINLFYVFLRALTVRSTL